jgi:hypothetical protein
MRPTKPMGSADTGRFGMPAFPNPAQAPHSDRPVLAGQREAASRAWFWDVAFAGGNLKRILFSDEWGIPFAYYLVATVFYWLGYLLARFG